MKKTNKNYLLVWTLVAVLPVLVNANMALAQSDATWSPVSSEKLVRLPTNYMEKALETNFRESSLAGRIHDIGSEVQMRGQTMAELRDSIELAEGEVRIELRHQFLAEKSGYLDNMQEQQQLRRRELNTKVRVFDSVLAKLRRDRNLANDPVALDLMQKQKEARSRMENAVSTVDSSLFEAMPGSQSEYALKYEENLSKMSELKQAISQHGANDAPNIDGQDVTREEYVRHLLASAEAELSLLDQEEEMLGYMAKLIALDAQELQHQLEYGIDLDAPQSKSNPARLANAVDFFVQ